MNIPALGAVGVGIVVFLYAVSFLPLTTPFKRVAQGFVLAVGAVIAVAVAGMPV